MEDNPGIRRLSSPVIRIVLSLVCAGITYFVWMGLFILLADSVGSLVKGILWLAAPVATAMGFAMGIFIHEHAAGTKKAAFASVFVWPLLGCSIGALVIYWRGPMLIVFAMFAFGTVSVILRELILHRKQEDRARSY
ncbi:MAG: hypothetical protein ACYTFQ_20925 [Planctomycetota bacterium]|jgi:hypothetical protein